MKRNCKRWVGILSLVLVVAFVMGIIPANELRADMNTHGEYNCSPLFVSYEKQSSWLNSTQGELNNRKKGQDPRKIIFSKKIEIYSLFGNDFYDRRKKEIDKILSECTYDDEVIKKLDIINETKMGSLEVP